MDKFVSEGKCFFCDKKYKQGGIIRHLQSHLKQEVANYKSKKKGLSYLVKAQLGEMFLIL